MAAEVLAGFPRNGPFGIARADVVTGGSLQDFERQALAAVGPGQLAERGLLGPGRAPWKSGASSLTGWPHPHAVDQKHRRPGGGQTGVSGKRVSVHVDLGCRSIIKKNNNSNEVASDEEK